MGIFIPSYHLIRVLADFCFAVNLDIFFSVITERNFVKFYNCKI